MSEWIKITAIKIMGEKTPLFFVALFLAFFSISILANPISGYSYDENHYAFFSEEDTEALGDTFYRNNEYFRCEARNLCKPQKVVNKENPLKKHVFFLSRDSDNFIVPVFLKCNKDGSGYASTAENLVPLLNKSVLEDSDCLDEDELTEVVSPSFVKDTLTAIQGYEGNCPKRESSCVQDIVENFSRDLTNVKNIFSLGSQKRIEAGCLTNFITNTLVSLYETVKLFVWDIPKGAFGIAKAGWNYFFGKEDESSSGLLASSVMSEEMAGALSDWDLPKFYQIAKKNFFNFFGQIKEYYTELLGCTEWEGAPYYSQCTKKMNWSCPNCDNFLNFACGLTSQLGTGFLLGGILGTTKSVLTMANIKKRVSLSPEKFGISPQESYLLKTNSQLGHMVENAKVRGRRAKFRASRAARPVTDFLTSAKEDLKFIFGVGDSFRTLIAANPVTFHYNMVYQKGKQRLFKAVNERQMKKIKGRGLNRARASALMLDSIRDSFEKLFIDYKKLRGVAFDQKLLKELNKDLFDEIVDQFEGTPVKVTRLPRQQGLVLEMGEESFTYQPRFAEKLSQASPTMKPDELKKLLVDDDILLSDNPAVTMAPDVPQFLRDIQEQAQASRGIFTIEPTGLDGYVYLGHFSAQVGNVPQVKDCSGKLNDVELLRSQEITDVQKPKVETAEEAAKE